MTGFQPNDPADDSPDEPGSREGSDAQHGDSRPPQRGDSGSGSGGDPLADLLGSMFGGGQVPEELSQMLGGIPGMPTDPASIQAMLAQVQQLLSASEQGPVNWDMARDVARGVAAQGEDPSVSESAERAVAEALRTADLWLERVCDLPSATVRTLAWSRAEWVENTLPVWQVVVEPIAVRVGDALGEALTAQAPEDMRMMIGQAMPMMRSMGGAFFGLQIGQAVGGLAREVVGGGDTGLPLLPAGRAVLLPVNVAAFGEGLGIDLDEIRLYLALRESAYTRLLSAVPWLRAHVMDTVAEYARGIRIDTERIESAVREIDPSDPEAMQRALADGLFEPEHTPAQRAALDRLETALALVEGWVDEVVNEAAQGRLPHAVQLRETMRRRRAAGGPAEHTFASLVGLELRPRRLREAAAVWEELTKARGAAGRDALWQHPDLVPDESAFADPQGFAGRDAGGQQDGMDAMDIALAELLQDAEKPSATTDPAESTDPDAGSEDGNDDTPDGAR